MSNDLKAGKINDKYYYALIRPNLILAALVQPNETATIHIKSVSVSNKMIFPMNGQHKIFLPMKIVQTKSTLIQFVNILTC